MELENSVNSEVAPTEEYSTDFSNDGYDSFDSNSEQGEVATPETGELNSSEETLSKPRQSQEENSIFAKIRRDAEQNARAKYDGFEDMLKAVSEFGYEGNPKEIAEAIKAQKQGISVGEPGKIEEQKSQRLKEFVNNLPHVVEAKKIINERIFENDLATIKKSYPEIKANSVTELGDVYMKLMAAAETSGEMIDPVVAYDAQLAFNKRTVKPTPPSLGSVKGNGVEIEKEFYTSSEVDRLTENQLSDPEIFERVRKSMTKWK